MRFFSVPLLVLIVLIAGCVNSPPDIGLQESSATMAPRVEVFGTLHSLEVSDSIATFTIKSQIVNCDRNSSTLIQTANISQFSGEMGGNPE
jgi:hypothetical protein